MPQSPNFLERALAASEGIEASVQAKALIAAANLAFIQSDYDRTEMLCKQSLTLYRELEDQPGIAFSVYLLGFVAWTRGNIAKARSLLAESLALAKAVDDEQRAAWSVFVQGLLESSQGEYARAHALFEESLAIHRRLQNKRGIAHALSLLADVLIVALRDLAILDSLPNWTLSAYSELA